jgi:hypothetical protein
LKAQIDQSIDLDTIQRRFEAKEADPHEYTKYFIDMMASLCAEYRDENIAKLRAMTDPAECFRLIFNDKKILNRRFCFVEELWKY